MEAEVADVDGRNCEGAEGADGEEAVGAPAVVLHPDKNFCMGLHISSPNLRLWPLLSRYSGFLSATLVEHVVRLTCFCRV